MTLKVQRLHPDAHMPTRAHPDDAGYDLVAIEPVELAPGERAMISTGLAVELPAGHLGWVVPRSGLAAKHGIALVNAPGLIDPGYRGELKVLLLNTDNANSFVIEPGMRIAQLVIAGVVGPKVEEVPTLSESGRGSGGFGSTGH